MDGQTDSSQCLIQPFVRLLQQLCITGLIMWHCWLQVIARRSINHSCYWSHLSRNQAQ